jgi:ribosome biogenesis GTPase
LSRERELDLALVVAGHGRHYVLETPEGQRLHGHPRGKKSETVVGDRVRFQPVGDNEGVIEHIEPRRNVLVRQDEWRTKSFAANLDQLLVLVAGEPMFSESQVARALIAANDASIPAFIVLNKTDLGTAHAARERLAPYRAMDIDVVEVSLKERPDDAVDLLAPRLRSRATLVLGPSGAGKSTLINRLAPDAQAQVGDISRALGTGRHTTTATRWYWLEASRQSALIDSPGFQEFGLQHLQPAQLQALMPDVARFTSDCRFHNCTHRQEPDCAVRSAAERGEIAPSRYRIYGEVLEELMQRRW